MKCHSFVSILLQFVAEMGENSECCQYWDMPFTELAVA